MSRGEIVGLEGEERTGVSPSGRSGIPVRVGGLILRVATGARGLLTKWRRLGAQRWAWVGAIGATLLATLVPVAFGQVAYNSLVALTLAGTLAIIFTAAYAAENLKEFRGAREAEYTPIIDVSITQVNEGGQSLFLVSLLNIGRGIAARVEASLWWMDSDLTVWIPHRVETPDHLLLPGHETSGRVEHPWVRFATVRHFRPGLPNLVLQVYYHSALKGAREEFHSYDLASPEERHARLGSFLTSSADRTQVLCKEAGITQQGTRDLVASPPTRRAKHQVSR